MNEAHMLAYIDPASGTLLLQVIVAGAIGAVGFFRKSIWYLLLRITGRGRSAPGGEDEAPHRPS